MDPAAARDCRATGFLGEAGLTPPELTPTLTQLPAFDFQPSFPNSCHAARSLLVQQRVSEPDYRRPESQIRHHFRTKKQKEAKCDENKWIFTKHEVAKAFDKLLSSTPLAAPGIAQALLSHTPLTSLEELWSHLQDPQLDKEIPRRSGQGSSVSAIPEIPWLDKVTTQENLDYIYLLCQARLEQRALDRAFGIALSKHSIDAMATLLSFGAIASAHQESIRRYLELDDIPLARLLLAAPNAMSVEAWRYCMEPKTENMRPRRELSPIVLLLCLAHRPDISCGDLILKAIESQNFQATAVILAYASSNEDFCDVRQHACELACGIRDSNLKHRFFAILAKSGFMVDGPTLRKELMNAVRNRQLPLVKLFVDAGVTLDAEPHNAISWAVSRMDLDMLELFKKGSFSSSISLMLNFVPDSISEPDMVRFIEIFGPGLAGEPLHSQLFRAVQKQQIQLIKTLLRYGASIEFKQASAIQEAIKKGYPGILDILLQAECSPQTISTTLKAAMALPSRPIRLWTMRSLLNKGVSSHELGPPLQRLMTEDGEVDCELIQLLLQHQAPLDGASDDCIHPIFVAVRRGNLAALRTLCDAKPRSETLSNAIPIAFGMMHACNYDVVQDMIRLLLQQGAAGLPVHRTLLTATKQDSQLGIVRLLVENGADANYMSGSAFAVAIESANNKLLAILCAGCSPSQASTEALLLVATDPRHYNLQSLELLLSSTQSAAVALNASWDSDKFRGNPSMAEVVPCFLRHGLDVDIGNGILLCFAIQEGNINLLDKILSANPSITSLSTAFQDTSNAYPRSVELGLKKLLLEKARSVEIGQSKSLLQETQAALDGDFAGLKLLLRHKAAVDFDDGEAVQTAAVSGSTKALDQLLLYGPTSPTRRKACLAAASSALSQDQKQVVFDRLLTGISTEDMTRLLADSVAKLPEYTQLPQLLIERDVKVTFKILKVALKSSSCDLFTLLACHNLNPFTVQRVFKEAQKITMDPDRKYWIYQHLLGRGVPNADVSNALLESLKEGDLGDLSVIKLLLEHGAVTHHDDCGAFALALRSNSVEAVKLLSQYLDDNRASSAFDLARKTRFTDPRVQLETYRCLLQWNISKSSIYCALLESLEDGHSNVSVVQLFLDNGANPNNDEARCFLAAAKAETGPEFRALSKHAKLGLVINALLNHFKEESEVVWWAGVCLEEQPHRAKINDKYNLLMKCLRKFPRRNALLKILLDHGVSPSTTVMHRLCAGWYSEPCTPLIWALFAEPRVGNDTILLLLARGGDAVLPAYSTPVTNVSAVLGCLLDKKRTPVLKALLDLDRDEVLNCTIPGSTFEYLATYPNISGESSFPDDTEISPRDAALFLGNFDAFCLIERNTTPNDGTLHLAALLALPKFIKWLPDTHNPNHRADEYNSMIPLALACDSKPVSWCKIANQESDWSTRQKKSIRLLAPKTKLSWRYRNKSILHIALDNGPEVTKVIIEALGIRDDPDRDEKYLYIDRTGIYHSPDQYVMRILEDDETEKNALRLCLKESGMISRYYRAVEPGAGTQPTGYHGLPPRLASLWKAHEESL
ncbi:hypothetical protein F5Y13DRAFT_50981 [Hypoxylon sp. FL1857]|nr:hypothetical protein F5Y13DRAFT_50981 [Hypoxylon sp. FL1857]